VQCNPPHQLGAEFTYRYQDLHHSAQRIAKLVPSKKVDWRVLDAEINFVKDKAEWNMVFAIAIKHGKEFHSCPPLSDDRVLREMCRPKFSACSRPTS
jgi:hypothetical protein